MKTITVLIEKSPEGGYWARTAEGLNGDTILNGTGDSVDAAKKDLELAYKEAKEDAKEGDKTFEDVEFVYKYDLQSFLDYFKVFNASELARMAGINPSLMRQYKIGVKKAGDSVYRRLSDCMEKIKKDLQAARF